MTCQETSSTTVTSEKNRVCIMMLLLDEDRDAYLSTYPLVPTCYAYWLHLRLLH